MSLSVEQLVETVLRCRRDVFRRQGRGYLAPHLLWKLRNELYGPKQEENAEVVTLAGALHCGLNSGKPLLDVISATIQRYEDEYLGSDA